MHAAWGGMAGGRGPCEGFRTTSRMHLKIFVCFAPVASVHRQLPTVHVGVDVKWLPLLPNLPSFLLSVPSLTAFAASV